MKRSVSKVAKEICDIIERWDQFGATLNGRAKDIVVPRDTLARWLLLLCPPAGPRKIRSESIKERRATTKELDDLCREVVFLRDGNRCRRCGREGRLDWAHVYSRRYQSLRHDPMNSLVLCRDCHMNFWHHRPAEAVLWLKSNVGEAAYASLVARAAKPTKVDPRLVKIHLQQEKARLST